MSRNATLLPIQPGSELATKIEALIRDWPNPWTWAYRSSWLRAAEHLLATAYPASSSADRNITARSLAPFPLVQPATRLNR